MTAYLLRGNYPFCILKVVVIMIFIYLPNISMPLYDYVVYNLNRHCNVVCFYIQVVKSKQTCCDDVLWYWFVETFFCQFNYVIITMHILVSIITQPLLSFLICSCICFSNWFNSALVVCFSTSRLSSSKRWRVSFFSE